MKRFRDAVVTVWLAGCCLPSPLAPVIAPARAQPSGLPVELEVDDTGAPAIFMSDLEMALRRARHERGTYSVAAVAARTPIDIGLVIHVLMRPMGEGALSDDVIAQQVAVVDAAFRDVGFHFVVADIRRHADSPYYRGGCFPTTESGLRMKVELAVEPQRFVNVYSCQLALPYIAGYGTLPNEFAEGDPRHGIVIDHATVPGSPAPLSLGHTLVHELGHYFGLLHTFQQGCVMPGDDIEDTPAEAMASYGCAIGRDSCPLDEGDDPVENFMDYSDDTCTNHFTLLQGERMRALVAIYRPGLIRSTDPQEIPSAHSTHRRP